MQLAAGTSCGGSIDRATICFRHSWWVSMTLAIYQKSFVDGASGTVSLASGRIIALTMSSHWLAIPSQFRLYGFQWLQEQYSRAQQALPIGIMQAQRKCAVHVGLFSLKGKVTIAGACPNPVLRNTWSRYWILLSTGLCWRPRASNMPFSNGHTRRMIKGNLHCSTNANWRRQ